MNRDILGASVWSKIVLACVLCAGCTPKASLPPAVESVQAPSVQNGTPVGSRGAIASEPIIVSTSDAERAEVKSLLVFLNSLNTRDHEFDRIDKIVFESPVQATAGFTWSGGFHSGAIKVFKEAGVWKDREWAYYF